MKHYDQLFDLILDTVITDEKDGYYAFADTVFYGEKGGMPSDSGTINNLRIIDLKWDGDTLYHKVDGTLSDPVHMEVDEETRLINVAVQSAYHILDGYYAKLGLYIIAIGVSSPENQWYEVNSKDLDEDHFIALQKYMNHTLLQNIPTTFTYYKGSEYPDPKYALHESVRVVSFGDLDTQPCGTPHVNNVNQIGSFIILGHEKTSRGTRIYTSVGLAANIKLQKQYDLVQELRKALNAKEDDLTNSVQTLLESNKSYKKQIDQLQKELVDYKTSSILKMTDTILIDVVDASQLRSISQNLLGKLDSTKILVSKDENNLCFAIVSPDNQAREILTRLQENIQINGGGSPKIVSGRCNIDQIQFINLLKTILNH